MFFCGWLLSHPIDSVTAHKVAQHFFYYRWGDARQIKHYPLNPENLIYLFYDDTQMVLVAGDDAVQPILGYSTFFNKEEENIPPAFKELLSYYEKQIKSIRNSGLEATNEIKQLWQTWLNGTYESSSKSSMPPLLHCLWDQGRYYNSLCPYDTAGPGNHVYAGCVATMMGMIMYYYRYPTQPTGYHSYQSPYGTLSVNFNQHQYKYEEMPYQLKSENLMVAKLLYHCGISVDMHYSPHGSGAYMHDVVESMTTHFGYHSSMYLDYKDSYTDNVWINKLKTELNAYHPIPYAGFDTSSGHAFVCDGYDEMDLFHFNWGWSGYYNGYYFINNLNPGYNFSNGQQAIFNCYPSALYNPGSCANYTMREKSGSIQVGYPFSNYSNNLQCTWLIDPDDTISGIDLYPAYFATESNNDVLTIYLGSDASAPVFATYSGTSIPSHITIPSQKLYITFTSNTSVTNKGFHIDYYCSTPIFCTINNILTDQSGYISDGSGTYPYRENTTCRWILKPNMADGIFLHFINFNLDYPDDALFVYKYPENYLLETFSGIIQNQTYYFPYPQLNLIFKTNDVTNKDGFLLHYSGSLAGIEAKEPWSVHYWFNDNNLEIHLKNIPFGFYQLNINDFSGRRVSQLFFEVNSTDVALSFPFDANPGFYLMNIENNSFRWSMKVSFIR